jgi:hypothetical protein
MLELEVVLRVLLHHVRIYSMWLECSTPAGQKLSPEHAGLPEEPNHLSHSSPSAAQIDYGVMILLESLFRERGIGNMGGVLLLMSYIEWGVPLLEHTSSRGSSSAECEDHWMSRLLTNQELLSTR